MADLLIRGGDVVTLDSGAEVLRGADVAVRDGAIVAVGDAGDGFQPAEVVDARDHLVLPGLFNGHTHSGTVLSRCLAVPETWDPWFDLRYTQDGSLASEPGTPLTGDDAYWAALLAAAEMIRSGTVGFGDQYFFMDRVAEAVLASGLRANLSWCTFGAESGEIGGDLAAVAAFVEKWQEAGDGRILTSFGPHSPYMCEPRFLARTAAVAARLGVGIRLRLAESAEQVDFSLLAYDLTPVEVLDRNGVLDVPVVAAHAAYLSEVDMEILATREASVIACPTVQRAAGLAATPVAALLQAGVKVGVGTDGAGVAGTLDMLRAARDLDAAGVDRLTALRLATRGSAQVLGFTNSGRLRAGACADLILVDCRRPHLWPVGDPLCTAAEAIRGGDVTDVMVGGRWLMRGGRLTTIDEARVMAEAAARAARLAGTRGLNFDSWGKSA